LNEIEYVLKIVGQWLGNFVKRITLIIIFELFKRLKVQKMATVLFRLRSEANKNVSIKIRLSLGRGNDLELNTGFTINPKDWSNDTNLPKQNNTENKLIFKNLKKLESFIFENLNNDLGNNILIDSFWLNSKIIECFNRVVLNDTGLLVNHITSIIDNANTRKVRTNGGFKIGLSKSTIKNYSLFKNIIKEYQTYSKKQIQFVEVNKPLVEKFTNWLINTKQYSTNYSGKQLEILKTVCIDAEKNEIKINPYSKTIQHFRESDKDRYIQTLSFEELETIRTATIEPAHLQNARNWLLIGCEIGQRGGDLLNITKENIRYKGNNIYLDVIQQKTNKSVTIGIIAPHVIDIIENNFPTKTTHNTLNVNIRKVCEIAKINQSVKGTKLDTVTNRKKLDFYPKYELIASHCFRRSFCTNYYKIMPTAVLIGTSGHSKESLFLTYINKREDKDANADLFMKFYEDLNKHKPVQMKLIKNNTKTA
jgi:integrase